MKQRQLPQFTCLQCGHVWIPRKNGTPLRCGKCKSPYWQREREQTRKARFFASQSSE